MRILLKCPTRWRPQRVIDTLSKYIRMANRLDLLGVAVSCDLDDTTMTRNIIQDEVRQTIQKAAWGQIFFSDNKSKIEACNADMVNIKYEWDIVVLVSDDMIPQTKGYDDIIRNQMIARFPDTRGILWFNDGIQEDKLNTLCVFGRKFYEQQGFIYHPAYKSLFCDTEFTDLCRTEYKDICAYIPYCIIRHEHPGTGFPQKMDVLYAANQKFWYDDMYTYISRKRYDYDWSVLIPTLVGREAGLQNVLHAVREKLARLAPDLRVEYCIDVDNREASIGVKRERLLQGARGKYVSFIDDDDDITDAYIEDLRETIRGNYHVMRLYGQMNEYNFIHSTEMTLQSPMASLEDPPRFQRPPNHLNPMLADVAKTIHYKNAIRGEDLDWAINLLKYGGLTNEYRREPIQVHYIYNLGERTVDPGVILKQRDMTYEKMLELIFTPVGYAAPPVASNPQPPEKRTLRLGSKGFVSS